MEVIWKSSKEADDRAKHTWKPLGSRVFTTGITKEPRRKPSKNLPPHLPLHWIPRTNTFLFLKLFQTFSKIESVNMRIIPPPRLLDRVPYTSCWPQTIMYWGDLLNSWSPFLTPKCWDGRCSPPVSLLRVILITEVRANAMSCHLEYSSVHSFPEGHYPAWPHSKQDKEVIQLLGFL